MMSNMNFGGEGVPGADGEGDFMPMMQHMMKSLISKEVLYPSLKDIADKVRLMMNDCRIQPSYILSSFSIM